MSIRSEQQKREGDAWREATRTQREFAYGLWGMAEATARELAEANGYQLRVTRRDGVSVRRTAACRRDRINVWLVNGLVFETYIG